MLPSIDALKTHAIFLDLDGTLVEIAEHPDAVRVHPTTLRLLEALNDESSGALAVISGRELSAIDRLLHPLKLPAAGVHGLERRDASGVLHTAPSAQAPPISFVFEKILGDETGVVIERKPGGVAVHYRLRPDLERRCCQIVKEIVGQRKDLRLIHGKMVFEILQKGADKGSVINAFLGEPPFQGRVPIFAGDDVTDEAGFAAVNSHGGISIKVGGQETDARFRAKNVQELEAWLRDLIENARGEQTP
ncbi:trehalose-phosphatase [Methylocystis bryophila]|uniref:Trehalose 6-phosphate phosphatase n=1 Tax=Methylocystis bryophila TaxID=655015 RepID=A0A1W6MUE3_9HYPH|nr:trehalose-phosphatase [Methylocystis bryophila]ARN81230.1 trehalose-phosphatase [Methylocystis bryophila]BDV37182.1 trehalose 6-phosphate phosphatase [Methylocystis bryophila]